ncbi:Membrane metallo-endopeptidase-like 1 [Folsomia candida]|uniref:Membrane metallo-endopeptidase-like 1 n=1 Tax=Folsomia candida TaxID=158441 RepID=A0A226EMW0_FOLCA|nr:Membrane metallo-endopeptidase-like 1 [Folsomia candida]
MFGHSGSLTFPMTYDYDFDGFYSSKRPGWKGFSSLEKSLSIALGLVSILALALMIAVIIVGVKLNKDDYKPPEKLTEATLYPPWVTTIPTTTELKEVTTRARPTTQLTSTTPIPPTETTSEAIKCTSGQCLQILESLDTSVVDPCENFYDFACGGWTIRNPVSIDNPSVDQFSKAQESFELEVKHILEESKANEVELDMVETAKLFYTTCLNDSSNATEDEENAEIVKLIDDMLADFDFSSGDLIPVLSKIRKELDGNYLLSLWIDVHLEDNSQNAIYLDHGNLDIFEEILTSESNTAYRVDLYKEFIISLWTSIYPEDSNIAVEIADKLVEFEYSLLQLRRSNNTQEFANVEILSTATGLDSENYTTVLRFINQTLSSDECSDSMITCNNMLTDVDIILQDLQYLSSFDALLNETDLNITVNYLKWRIILDFAKHSSEMHRDLYDHNILGFNTSTFRWEMCVKETLRFFGPPLVAEYVQAKIANPVKLKLQVLGIADYLKHTALTLTQEVTWIASNATRDIISQKLEELQIFALYPLSLTDENINIALAYYSNLNLTNPSYHFQNMLDLTAWQSASELNLVWGTSNDTMQRKELEIQTSNEVVYSYLTNSIYIPTAVYQPQFYSIEDNGSMAFVYGSMGTLIGRQIIAAIEESAVSYYKGVPSGMWDEETLANFQSSSNCMQDEYNAYNISFENSASINGESTVKTNTLDVGGFKIALKSYWYAKMLLDEHEINGLAYSPEKLFFIGFAQTWCASYSEDKLLQEITQGSQTPVPYRVNVVVESFNEFSQTWNCSKPIQQSCHLWSN